MIKTKNFNMADDVKLSCSCGCNNCEIKQETLTKLQHVRKIYNKSMVITSGYRCKNHPVEKIKKTVGTHQQGLAFDIAIAGGNDRYRLILAAFSIGAGGIGVANTFIHIDFRKTKPMLWIY